jgi:hypothetical protein
MAETLTTEQQLAYLRTMTIRTEAIHEAQALQLRNWPLLIPGIVKAEARVDVPNKTVVFHCKSKSGKAPITKAMKVTCNKITMSVQRLILWPDTKVVFKIDGKVANVD